MTSLWMSSNELLKNVDDDNEVLNKIVTSIAALNTRMDQQQSQNAQYQQPSLTQQQSYRQQQSFRPNGNNFRGRGKGRGNGYRCNDNNRNNRQSYGGNIHAGYQCYNCHQYDHISKFCPQ